MSTRLFLRNTQTNAGTGGIGYDLSATQGSPTTLNTGSLNDTAYTEMLWWQITVNNTIGGTSFPVSINIANFSGTVGYRFRVQRVNSSNVVQASSAYSSVFSTTGTSSQTLTLSTTWNTGDRLRISLEIARTGGHGNVDATVNVNNANTFVDYTPRQPIEESVTISTNSGITSLDQIATFYEESVTISSEHTVSFEGLIFDRSQNVTFQPEFPENNATGVSTRPDFRGQVFDDPEGTLNGANYTQSALFISKTDTNEFGFFKDLGFEIIEDDYIVHIKITNTRFIFFKLDRIQAFDYDGTTFTPVGNPYIFQNSDQLWRRLVADVRYYGAHIIKISDTRYLLAYQKVSFNDLTINILNFDETDWTFLTDTTPIGTGTAPYAKDFVSYAEDRILYFSQGSSRLITYDPVENSLSHTSITNLVTSSSVWGVKMVKVAERKVILSEMSTIADLRTRFCTISSDDTTVSFNTGHDYGFIIPGGSSLLLVIRGLELISPSCLLICVYENFSRQTYFAYVYYVGPNVFVQNTYIAERFIGQITGSPINDIVSISGISLSGTDLIIFRRHNDSSNGWIFHKAKVNDVQRILLLREVIVREGDWSTYIRKEPNVDYPALKDQDIVFTASFPPSRLPVVNSLDRSLVPLLPNTTYYWSFYPIFILQSKNILLDVPYAINYRFTTGNDSFVDIDVNLDSNSLIDFEELLEPGGGAIEESIALNIDAFIDVVANHILNALTTLNSVSEFQSFANLIADQTSNISADSDTFSMVQFLLEVSANIESDAQVEILSSLVFDSSASISASSDIVAELTVLIEGVIDLISNGTVVSQASIIFDEVITLLKNAEVEYDSLQVLEAVITITSDHDLLAQSDVVFDNSIDLDTVVFTDAQINLIANGVVELVSTHLVEFQVFRIVETVIDLLSDSGIVVDSEAVYENAISLLTDADFIASIDAFIDESIEISSAHFTESQSEAIFDALVELTVNSAVEAQINKIIDGVVTLLADSDIETDINSVISAVALVLSSSNINVEGNIETEESVTISSDHDLFVDEDIIIELAAAIAGEALIDVQIEAIISEAITILSESGIEADTEMIMEAFAEIISGSEVIAALGSIILEEVNLETSHFTEAESTAILQGIVELVKNAQIDPTSIAQMEQSADISGDADIQKTGNLEINSSVSLNLTSHIEAIGNLLIEKNIQLFSESFISAFAVMLIEEDVVFETDIQTEEGVKSVIEKVTELIINAIVQASADSDTDVDTVLNAGSQFEITVQQLASEVAFLIANSDLFFTAEVENLTGSEIQLFLSTGIISQGLAEFLSSVQIPAGATDLYQVLVEYFGFIGLEADAQDIYEFVVEINTMLSLISDAVVTFTEEYVPGQPPMEYEEFISISAIAQIFVNLATLDKSALKIIGISMFRFINKLR